ncbi:unnamed protein product [Allacma fusca]|uniref:Uncharacterized protein n=1 Tax=Allacma fusca TaxID=39272 RepID=A0A8J2Q320_9HEXA|nr:unnamed protein product [Allacma fusca]
MWASILVLIAALATISEVTCAVLIGPNKNLVMQDANCDQVRCFSSNYVCQMEPSPNAVCTLSFPRVCEPMRPVCKPRPQVLPIYCGSILCPTGTICRKRTCSTAKCISRFTCVRDGAWTNGSWNFKARKATPVTTIQPTTSTENVVLHQIPTPAK